MKRIALYGWMLVLTGASVAQEKAWRSKAELSYVNTSGNTTTRTFSGKLELKGEKGPDRFSFDAGYLNARDDGTDKASRLTTNLRYERVFTGRLFGFLGAEYLRDRFAGYAHRISLGPGLGLDVLKGETHTLKGLLSSEFVHETFFPSEAGEADFASARLGFQYGWKVRENVSYSLDMFSTLSLKDPEKYYFRALTSLSVMVNRAVSVGISYEVNYQNRTPAPGVRHTDASFLTSLIIAP